MPRRASLALVIALVSCGGERPAAPTGGPVNVAASLGGDVVARVGDVPIHRALVLSVARARGVSAQEALRLLVDEALMAISAEKANAHGDDAVRKDTASALSRALLAKLRAQGLAAGPWTDAELAQAMGPRWIELESPETRAVVHALVKKDAPNAAELAAKLRVELASATPETNDRASHEKVFTERAKAFPMPPDNAVIIEVLPPITEDGRIAVVDAALQNSQDPSAGRMVAPFAKGTFAVPALFGTSDVVVTEYGYHVLRVLEIRPPVTSSRETKIEKLQVELLTLRAGPLHQALIDRLRKESNPVELGTADDLGRPR